MTRELPAVVLVEADAMEDEAPATPTAEFSSSPTWNEMVDDAPATLDASEIETQLADQETQSAASGDELQAAAQRIDEWFKSAKTVSDAPQIPDTNANPNANGATIDLSAEGLPDLADFELEDPAGSSPIPATWGDSNDMNQLLADIESPAPSDSFEPADAIAEPQVDEMFGDMHERDEMVSDSAKDSLSEDAPAIATSAASKPRRKRSLVRLLATVVVAGMIGSGIGYYALLWISGKSADFLNVAQYLPKAMLPAEFAPRQFAAAAPPLAPLAEETAGDPIADTSESTSTSQDSADTTAAAGEVDTAAVETPAESAEVQAAYTAPDDAVATADSAIEKDRYALDTPTTEDTPQEPAPLESPAAVPMSDGDTDSAAAKLENAPSFTTDELTAALSAAQKAQPGLTAGDLNDSKEVQRAKGYSYSMLADLAQKAMFVDASANPEATAESQKAADELFRTTLADAHTRGEVARILPKWIASKHRKHGGAFFAASLSNPQQQGSLTEFQAQLDGGQSIAVLIPAELAARLDASARPMGVVGWIIDQPAQHVPSYTGAAEQAVWVGNLIPLD